MDSRSPASAEDKLRGNDLPQLSNARDPMTLLSRSAGLQNSPDVGKACLTFG